MDKEMKDQATVREIPVCGCTGEQLEAAIRGAFKTTTQVPSYYRCRCGIRYPILSDGPPTRIGGE